MPKTEAELIRQRRQTKNRKERAKARKRESREAQQVAKQQATGAMVIPPHIAALAEQVANAKKNKR